MITIKHCQSTLMMAAIIINVILIKNTCLAITLAGLRQTAAVFCGTSDINFIRYPYYFIYHNLLKESELFLKFYEMIEIP